MLQRIIPSSGEKLPVIGLGTWQTFDKTNNQAYPVLKQVLGELHSGGGRMIDSSPMYGQSEKVIGEITSDLSYQDDFFYATKVWTTGRQQGIDQMENSLRLMKRKSIDLMQVHNLLDVKSHLPELKRWKETGRTRYIGFTHYTDAYHEALIEIMKAEKPDFVQFNYSIFSRNAEEMLLPVAAELGIATIINRPFGEGNHFNRVKEKPIPGWALETGIKTWPDYFLKYIISHPAVTCVIPATANPAHAAGNVLAGSGYLPDIEMRKRMADHADSL